MGDKGVNTRPPADNKDGDADNGGVRWWPGGTVIYIRIVLYHQSLNVPSMVCRGKHIITHLRLRGAIDICYVVCSSPIAICP